MMSRLKVLVAAALLVGGAAACSDSTGVSAPADGTYTLNTISGNPLPFTVPDGFGNTVSIQSDFYSINSDGSYTETGTFQPTGQQPATRLESGSWTQSNNVVQFNPDQSSTHYFGTLNSGGTVGGQTLSISLNGAIGIYVEN